MAKNTRSNSQLRNEDGDASEDDESHDSSNAQLEFEREETKRREIEFQREKMKLEFEREKMKINFEREKLRLEELDKDRAERDREHERLKELNELGITLNTSDRRECDARGGQEKIQIPYITDTCEPHDILVNFERICKTYGVPEDKWLSKLLPFLGNRANGACARMKEEDARSYQKVKDKILEEFQVTPEKCRRGFRNAVKKPGESYAQLGTRIRELFSRWGTGIWIGKTYEELEDLILREQLENAFGQEISIFVLERELKNFDDAIKIADRFDESRQRHKGQLNEKYVRPKMSAVSRPEQVKRTCERPVIECYNCREKGHYSRDCPRKFRNHDARPRPAYFIGLANKSANAAYDRTMIINGKTCKGIRDTGACVSVVNKGITNPNQLTGEQLNITTISGEIKTLPVAEVDVLVHGQSRKMRMLVTDSSSFDFLLGNDHGEVMQIVHEESGQNGEGDIRGNIFTGESYLQGAIVNGHYVQVLRDSATDECFVKPELVQQRQFTGKMRSIRTVTGKILSMPTANVDIEDLKGKRVITACVNGNQPYPVIMGNNDGEPLRPVRQILIVQTRAQTKARGASESRKGTNESRGSADEAVSTSENTDVKRSGKSVRVGEENEGRDANDQKVLKSGPQEVNKTADEPSQAGTEATGEEEGGELALLYSVGGKDALIEATLASHPLASDSPLKRYLMLFYGKRLSLDTLPRGGFKNARTREDSRGACDSGAGFLPRAKGSIL